MSIEMKSEYKGHTIKYSDHENFVVSFDGVELKRDLPTLEKCQNYIDTRMKAKFQRVKVLCELRYHTGIVKAEATSLVDDNHVWVTDGKDRAKENIKGVYLDNEKNNAILGWVNQAEEQIKGLEKKISDYFKSLDRLTPEMMTGK